MPIDYTWTNVFVGDDYNNTLVGSVGQDELYGYGGDDIIVGDFGEDHIDGSNGNDLLAGASLEGFLDPEPDIFVFDLDDGNDTITDFTPASYDYLYPVPGDQIVLLGGTPNDVGNILASATTTVTGQTILVYGNTTVGLNGIDETEVSPDWFLLA
jgi:Ca2+-binding RTX toxin-like protein